MAKERMTLSPPLLPKQRRPVPPVRHIPSQRFASHALEDDPSLAGGEGGDGGDDHRDDEEKSEAVPVQEVPESSAEAGAGEDSDADAGAAAGNSRPAMLPTLVPLGLTPYQQRVLDESRRRQLLEKNCGVYFFHDWVGIVLWRLFAARVSAFAGCRQHSPLCLLMRSLPLCPRQRLPARCSCDFCFQAMDLSHQETAPPAVQTADRSADLVLLQV